MNLFNRQPLAFGEGKVRPRITNTLNRQASKVWVLAAAGVLCVALLLLCALNPITKKSRNPFGHRYRVEEVVYGASSSSDEIQLAISPEGALYAVTHLTGLEGKVFDCKVTLTPNNFDPLFRFDESAWSTKELSAAKLREGNKATWILGTEQTYYLLLQKNGDVYLAHGYLDYGTVPSSSTSKSNIFSVMKLIRNDWLFSAVTSNGSTTKHHMAWQPKSEYNYEAGALPRISVMKDDIITFHVEDEKSDVLNVTENYHFTLDGSEDTRSVHIHKLSQDKSGGFALRIAPRSENTGDFIVYRILRDDGWYSFRVDISDSDMIEK